MPSSFQGDVGDDDASHRELGHLGPEEGAGLLQGWLAPEERAKVEAHIDRCPECRKYISELALLSWAGTSLAQLGQKAEEHDLSCGTSIGRYVIDGWLGRGAMGVVYAAYDPKLHRKVALKMVDASVSGGTARLEQEAQAMARLSHPNVVAIHDIGVHEGHLFIAMEFIEGVTLRSWLRDETRSFREVLEVFVQAGRGLEAAHESGLIHRDFKPDNVLCGSSGRVLVSDFGLARPALGATVPEGSTLDGMVAALEAEASAASKAYLAGTPLYMAPEQYLGRVVGARSDQFSFSVALYQALYRQHPFEGKTLGQLAGAVTEGKVEEPRSRGEVPLRVHRAILRGLQADPNKRFPSMSEYLQVLSTDPLARRRRLAGAAALGALLLASPFVYRHWQTEAVLACGATAEGEISGAWGNARKGAVRSAFFATGKPFAAGAWNGVERALDDWARDWSDARVDACKASRGHRSFSGASGGASGAFPSLVDARMACLDERLKEMSALAEVLTHADTDMVIKAPGGVRSLPAPAQCNDTGVLFSRLRPPPDAIAGQVSAIRDQLARAEALRFAGHYKEGRTVTEQAVQATENLDYPVVQGEALERDGEMLRSLGRQDDADTRLRRAVAAADAAGDDITRARALTRLMQISALQAKYELATRFNEEAKSAIVRAGGDVGLEGERRFEFAIALDDQSKFEDALREYEAALPLLEAGFGKTSEQVLYLLLVLGQYHSQHGQYDEAWSRLQHLLAVSQEVMGPRHPLIANLLNSLGEVLRWQMRFDEAEGYYQRALEIAEEAGSGPENTAPVVHLDNLGNLALERGRSQEAIAYFQRALSLREKKLGPDHQLLLFPLAGLGEAYLLAGDRDKAIEHLERALRVRGNSHGVDELARAQFSLAKALAESGRDPARALQLALDAQSTYRQAVKSPLAARDAAEVDRWIRARIK